MDANTQVKPEINKNEIMGGVIPYISLARNVDEAIGFYETAFGAVLVDKPARDPEGVVLNATLAINGGAFMLMDHPRKVQWCNGGDRWSRCTPAVGRRRWGSVGGPAQRMQAAT